MIYLETVRRSRPSFRAPHPYYRPRGSVWMPVYDRTEGGILVHHRYFEELRRMERTRVVSWSFVGDFEHVYVTAFDFDTGEEIRALRTLVTTGWKYT